MKRFPLPLLLLAVLLPGCVRSLHPIYTGQTLTYDPAMLGTWADTKGETRLEIAASSGNEAPGAIPSYQVVHTDGDNHPARLVAHLAKVGDLLVADLTVADEQDLPASDFYKAHLVPLHTFWIVRREGAADGDAQTLSIRAIDSDWLRKMVDENPAAVAHYKSRDDVILTAPPDVLQKFLLAHVNDPGMLTEAEIFRRVKGPATTATTTTTTAPAQR